VIELRDAESQQEKINHCSSCIRHNENECCRNVYIVLNTNEVELFKNEEGFRQYKDGGIYYSDTKYLYLNDDLVCTIHDDKPLYCKYYPIFITGKVFVDESCPFSKEEEYVLIQEVKKEIDKLKDKFVIYQEEWFWEDIKELYNLE